jgi:hypothetical protein
MAVFDFPPTCDLQLEDECKHYKLDHLAVQMDVLFSRYSRVVAN